MSAANSSPSSSASSSTPPNPNPNSSSTNPVQSWWESLSRARSRVLDLASLLTLPALSTLADSDRPAAALLACPASYSAVSSAVSSPSSGSGADPLCHWLYDTFQSPDPDLKLVVLSFVPLISGLYLSRVISSPYSASLAGFESVMLTIYQSETRSRAGKPLTISIPDLSQPSLYHTPGPTPRSSSPPAQQQPKVGILAPPLEPQMAVKSTKRACIVGVALDCYYKKISQMPAQSKIDFCEFVVDWAGQDCSCRYELDNEEASSLSLSNFEGEDGESGSFSEGMRRLGISEPPNGSCCNGDSRGSGHMRGCRIPLPWELLQPVLRILGHCLLAPRNTEEVQDAASAAVRSVYARTMHELMPQGILAVRSLIRLDNNARTTVKDAAGMMVTTGVASNPTTPSKPKKLEMFLGSK